MFFKYSIFELKVFLRNRRRLFLGLILLLFFPLYFQYYKDIEHDSLEKQKLEEHETQKLMLNGLPHDLQDTEEGKEIYDNYAQQLSFVNWQLVSLHENEAWYYVENGRVLNQLRMEMHEKGNPHVVSQNVVPIVEIEKDNKIYDYLDKHNLNLDLNPFVASQFLVDSAQIISGLFIYVIVLLICSDIFVYENDHQSVLRGLPVSFFTKALSKFILHFLFIILCLSIGIYLGYDRIVQASGKGNFFSPILVYKESGFEAIAIKEYLSIVSIGLLLSICLIIAIALLFNRVFNNIYVTALVGTGLFFLPDILHSIGIKATFLYPIKYIDITAVLSGELAEQFGETYIDYSHSIVWLAIFTFATIVLLFIINKLDYRKNVSQLLQV